jgi:hypothetical protein
MRGTVLIGKVIPVLLIVLLPAGLSAPAASPQSGQERGLGLKLATPEMLRGIPLAFTPFSGDELPRAVDLSKDMPPVGNQGKQMSCTAWSVAYAVKSYQEKLEERRSYVRSDGTMDANNVFSPSFIYNQINNGRDSGSFFVDAFNLLHEQGAASWADMPYQENDFTSPPNPPAKARAKRYRIDYYRQINVQDPKEIKAHLNAGYPVLIGATVDQAFRDMPSGQIWRTTGQPLGAHAMVVIGYDDGKNAFKVMNSWGRQWGDNGFGWIDYALFRRVVNEAYVVKDALNSSSEAVVEPQPQPQPRPQPRPDDARPRPQPQPVWQPAQASLAVTNVQHNAYYTNRPDLGYFMTFSGTIDIPAGTGRSDQVVIYFHFDMGDGQKGRQVQSLNPNYTDPYGFVACGTTVYPVPPLGLKANWQAWVPYSAFNVMRGQYVWTPQGQVYQQVTTYLVAQPVLFVDNFGVAYGQPYRFFVNF